VTSNGGAAALFRNDQLAGHRSLRLRLIGTKSNRDAIGATVRVVAGGSTQTRTVHSGSSYLSQSELPVTFGLGKHDRAERIVVTWPSGRSDEFKNVAAGRGYECVEGKTLTALDGF
jgi:enediyne biosynthesis protein E4